jgi:hypothetical protein
MLTGCPHFQTTMDWNTDLLLCEEEGGTGRGGSNTSQPRQQRTGVWKCQVQGVFV